MKKMKTLRNLLLAALMLFAFGGSAQHWTLTGVDINNNNTGYVGVGFLTPPSNLLHAAKNMTGPQIIIENLGGIGGAGFTMIDASSTANWKFKATSAGGFKIRDHAFGLDVLTIEQNSAANCIYIGSNDVIGFGTSTPVVNYGNKLDIKGDVSLEDANAWVEVNNTTASSNAGINFLESGTYKGWVYYNGSNDMLTLSCDATGFGYMLNIHPSGAVTIGTTAPATGYKLSVNGKVACEEVLVKDNASWPDYVFGEEYELMSLKQLEKSIEKNNHLPGLPTAAEIEENGFELADMQRRVLEKVEELTLYTIDQGKMIEAQGKLIKELQKKIEALEKDNKNLKRSK